MKSTHRHIVGRQIPLSAQTKFINNFHTSYDWVSHLCAKHIVSIHMLGQQKTAIELGWIENTENRPSVTSTQRILKRPVKKRRHIFLELDHNYNNKLTSPIPSLGIWMNRKQMSGTTRVATEALDETPGGSQWSERKPRKTEHECKQILQRCDRGC